MGKGKGKKVRADASKYDIELFGRQKRIGCRVIWNCPTASHCMPSSTVFSPLLGVESPSVVFFRTSSLCIPVSHCRAASVILPPEEGRKAASLISQLWQGKQADDRRQAVPARENKQTATNSSSPRGKGKRPLSAGNIRQEKLTDNYR